MAIHDLQGNIQFCEIMNKQNKPSRSARCGFFVRKSRIGINNLDLESGHAKHR